MLESSFIHHVSGVSLLELQRRDEHWFTNEYVELIGDDGNGTCRLLALDEHT